MDMEQNPPSLLLSPTHLQLSIQEDQDPTITIIKNSTIPVNVDDLGPGLIIVTYIHKNGTLYQGVLLQLNRERGIPCGISFPKDLSSMIPSKSKEFENEEDQCPVNQRHTYFQRNSNFPIKPLRRFNRATKPPARYKNGRLALRLRHRPVLCSKCQAYCDELTSIRHPPKDSTVGNGNESLKVGMATRRSTPKTKSQERRELKDGESLAEGNSNGSSNGTDDMEDYSFTLMPPINSSLVENYWKRPNLKPEIPEPERIRHSGKTEDKSSTVTSFKSFLSLKPIADSSNQLISSSTPSATQNSTLFQTKTLNLKFCINKLQIQKQSEYEPSQSNLKNFDRERILPQVFPSQLRITTPPSSTTGKSRTRKRSTTVPARFRDEACLTKNVFDFKKRKRSAGNKVVSNLKNEVLDPETQTTEIGLTDQQESEKRGFSDCSSSTSGSSRKSLSEGRRNSSPMTTKTEMNRTPTIKISFGTSGQGVVVEIPSKPTLESSPDSSMSPAQSKAEKKAMRKAKKQAKRKLSPQPYLSSDRKSEVLSITMPISQELSSSQSSCSSPPPPLLTPISDFCPPATDEDFPINLDHCPPLIHFTNEIPLTPKKRKKDKKHKKYKGRRENDSGS